MFQDNEIRFENISLQQGLSQSVVECIVQDYIGFMWFGTQDGLNKFDGYKFTIYKNDQDDSGSVSNNFIRCLFEDSRKNLWIGTGNGLSRYNRVKDEFINYKHDPKDAGSLSNNDIRAINEDSDGDLWIGTYGGGLEKYNFEKDTFEHNKVEVRDTDFKRSNRVNCIFEDSRKQLWIGTWGGGVFLFEKKKNQFIPFNLTDSGSLGVRQINCITESADGKIIICCNHGVFFVNPSNGKHQHYLNDNSNNNSISDDFVSCAYSDKNNNLWIGTREGGLNLLDTKSSQYRYYKNESDNPFSISNNSIMTIYEDRSGILWIGTFGGGINKVNSQSKKIRHYYFQDGKDNCVSSNKIYSFDEDEDGNIWIGTWDCGLNKFSNTTNEFLHFLHDPENENTISQNTVNAIAHDKKGNIWVATSGGGLNVLEKNSGNFRKFVQDNSGNSVSNNTIFSLKTDKYGDLWIGTAAGLDKFEIEKKKFTNYSQLLTGNASGPLRIRTIHIGNDDTIWLGVDNGGLISFKQSESKFTVYKNIPGDSASLSSNYVLSIYEDSKGVLWIGTLDAGLNKFLKDEKKFKRYSTRNGLPNNSINGILEDHNGNLWISTNNGITKFDPMNETFRNYDVSDGFQSNEFNPGACIKLENGEFIFGGINGYNVFKASEITDNKLSPPVVISDFQIFNKSVDVYSDDSPIHKHISLEKNISLTHRESVFSFEIVALDFNSPMKNQYAYKMEGFDKDWVYSGTRRFVTYTNLNPGEYVFRIKGSNNDLVWNNEGTSIKISITPPFWKTGWFKLIGVAAAVSAGSAIYRSKLSKIEKEKKAQEEFTKRLIDVQENDRKKIAAELHDSIGHDLLITKNKLLLSAKNPDDKEGVLSSINEVSGIISDTLKEVREISYNLHPYQIERLGLSKAIKSIIDRARKSTEIVFTDSIDNIDSILVSETEISLYRIIQECINNIIKHSQATEVILNVNNDGKEISVLISDNGIGFDPDKLKRKSSGLGFGLAGIRERVKLINGHLEIDSSKDNGTSIMLHVNHQ